MGNGASTSKRTQATSEVPSGRTNQDRKLPSNQTGGDWALIEKKQELLPVNGLSSAMRTRRPPRKKGAGKGSRGVPSLPPRLELVVTVDCVRRFFFTNSASATPLTRRSMAGSIGGVVTVANTTVTLYASSFRVRSITVWPAAGTSVHIDVPSISSGAEQALSKESVKNEYLPTGVTVDHPVVWKPKRGTYLDMWQNTSDNGTDQLLAVSGAAGAVLDVHYQFTLSGAVSAAPSVTTTTVAAVGTVGCMCLDTGNKFGVVVYNQFNW